MSACWPILYWRKALNRIPTFVSYVARSADRGCSPATSMHEYHQLGFAHDPLIVVIGVICDDHHAIVLAKMIQRRALHLQVILAAVANCREIRIVVTDFRALLLQQFDNR